MKLKFSEADLLKQVKDYLNYKNIFFWRNHQSLGSQRGISDLMVLHKGIFYALELKTGKGKLSMYQKIFLESVNQNRGIGKEIRNTEEVIELFKEESKNENNSN